MLRGGESGYLDDVMPSDCENDPSDGKLGFNGSLKRKLRRSKDKRKKIRRSKAQCNMVMVDQLWLWIVGGKVSRSLSPDCLLAYQSKDTIVTSFPRKWTEPNGEHEDDVLDRLLQHLRADKLRQPITSVYALANLIITFCTNVFDRTSISAQLRLHDLFACSIGVVVSVNFRPIRDFTKQWLGQ